MTSLSTNSPAAGKSVRVSSPGHKQLLITSLFLLCALTIRAQSYLPYYTGIYTAHKHIAAKNYQLAADQYYRTFQAYTFRFARDCWHAAESAALAGDSAKVAYFVEASVRQGIPLSYMSLSKALLPYHSTPLWTSLSQHTHAWRQSYLEGINQTIRAEIIEMFEADQQARARYYAWYNLLFRPILGMKWRKLNAQQVTRMVEITQMYGFPGEKLIGIDLPSQHSKIDSLQLSAGMPIVILLHHYSHPNPSHDHLFHDQVLQGNLWNRHFATVCDFEATYGKGKHQGLAHYQVAWKENALDNEVINLRRRAIGLPDVAIEAQLKSLPGLTRFYYRLY